MSNEVNVSNCYNYKLQHAEVMSHTHSHTNESLKVKSLIHSNSIKVILYNFNNLELCPLSAQGPAADK